jgi:hypothetical protein
VLAPGRRLGLKVSSFQGYKSYFWKMKMKISQKPILQQIIKPFLALPGD